MPRLFNRIQRALTRRKVAPEAFTTSRDYWETRYRTGRDSGAGSRGELARFKAETINAFVAECGVRRVVEFGCGDGRQLALAEYPSYLGLDVSPKAVEMCRRRFRGDETKSFRVLDPATPAEGVEADLALSLDVIYHLVEDEVFEAHMRALFAGPWRHVIIFSSNEDERVSPHVRRRRFTDWVEAHAEGWALLRRVENPHQYQGDTSRGSTADFYIYERRTA